MSDIRALEECREFARRQFRLTQQPTFLVSLDHGEDGYDYDVLVEEELNEPYFKAFDGVIIEAFE